MATELSTDTREIFDYNELDQFDSEWERRMESLADLTYRLSSVRKVTGDIDTCLDRDDEVQLADLLALHDKVNALIAFAIGDALVVDSVGNEITYSDWENLTQPAVYEDEVVLEASEFERALDRAYIDGSSDTYDEAIEEGIDLGIMAAVRVLRVMNARLTTEADLARG